MTVSDLMNMQRRLAESENPFERVVGTLWAAGTLQKRLAQLSDRQIGQLLYDFVGDELPGLYTPETTICHQAALRLFRSESGSLTPEENEATKRRTTCPKCGNEMLLQYGIDEPDHLECVLVKCGNRIPA
jgi:hypothetical protein